MAQQARPPSAGPSNFAWEGDSTLHSYCYDYMRKRGWNDSASRFAKDAGIDEATWTGPPIEAPQGLLYEWWSVFWDVFIARSQKAGQRNPNADLYVEAMRAKRDPLVVQFAGQNPPPPMNLPRSLAHPPRAPPSQAGGPPRAQYSQMHVLEQQELQNQMQRGRVQQVQVQRAGPGGGQPPPPGAYGPPGSQQPPHMHAGPSQGPLPPQHGGANVPQPLMPPYPPQNPHQPPSVHSSPHLVNASPYTNGRIPPQQGQQMGMGPPPPQQQQQQQQQGPMSAAMASAMNAVGLGGRDPDSLSQEEHAAVAAQMRRVGALPPTPQQGQMRNQPMRVVQQRIPPDQQMRQQGPYAGMPPQGQQMMQDPNRPGMQQLPPQQRMVQAQYGPPPGQAGSPASPAYSAASPYTTPHVAHMQIPPPGSQSSPQQFIAPLPPPSRGAGNGKNRLPSAGGLPPQGSPAQMGGMQNQNVAAKRLGGPGGGGMEDPSPRGRKRVRGGTRDEEMFGPGGMPETPNFDPGGPGSPGGMMGMVPGGQGFGPDGIPYRPSPSPQLMQPPDGKRPLPPGMGPPPQQAMYVTGPSPGPQQQQYMGGPGDMGINGGGGGGHSSMNGTLSRPTSAASNHHFLGAPPGPDQRVSPGPHPQQGGVGGNGMPPPPPHQHPSPGQQLGGPQDPNSLGVGGSRPFAGAPNPPSASTTPLPPPPQNLAPPPPDQQQANGIPVGDSAGGGGGGGGDDVFAGIDNIDFDSFLNGDMFAEDGTS